MKRLAFVLLAACDSHAASSATARPADPSAPPFVITTSSTEPSSSSGPAFSIGLARERVPRTDCERSCEALCIYLQCPEESGDEVPAGDTYLKQLWANIHTCNGRCAASQTSWRASCVIDAHSRSEAEACGVRWQKAKTP